MMTNQKQKEKELVKKESSRMKKREDNNQNDKTLTNSLIFSNLLTNIKHNLIRV